MFSGSVDFIEGYLKCILILISAIFDTGECESFAEKLETRIHVHDRDIEKLCSAHHQGFIESIKDLLELKGLANKINVYSCYSIFILYYFL